MSTINWKRCKKPKTAELFSMFWSYSSPKFRCCPLYFGLICLLISYTNLFGQNKEKDSLLHVISREKNDSLVIDAYNKLFFHEVYSDQNSAKKIYEKVFKIGQKNPFALARANNMKGIFLDINGQYDSAFHYYTKAIALSKNKFPNVEGSAYNNIGLIYWNRGQYYQALTQYSKALNLFEKIGNKTLQGNVLSNIGLIYSDINDLKKSEYYLKKSLKIREEMNDEYGVSVSLVNLGILYSAVQRYEESIKIFDRALHYKKKVGDEIGAANALYNQAFSYLKLKNYQKSLSLLQTAKTICLKNDSEANNLVNIYVCEAENYVILKNFGQVKTILPKIKTLLDKNKDERNLANYYKLQSEYFEGINDHKNALFYFKKQDSVSSITEGLDVKKAINLYETKYETEKKEKDLIRTKNNLLVQENKNRQKNIFLGLAFLILVLGILVGYLLYRSLKLRNRHLQQEFELQSAIEKIENQNRLQEQRLSISRDLHDNIGSQLTFIISSIDLLKRKFPVNDEEINTKLARISTFAKETIAELRDTIWAMNTEKIGFEDLRFRLLNFIQKAEISSDDLAIELDFDEDLEAFFMPSDVGMNVYRIIQEAVNNAIKHANAKHIKISIENTESGVNFSILDDGNGYTEKAAKNGNGLANMAKRANVIGKNFEITAEEGSGCKIIFSLEKSSLLIEKS